MKNKMIRLVVLASFLTALSTALRAQPLPPPTLGQDTKGALTTQESNIPEGATETSEEAVQASQDRNGKNVKEKRKSPFGQTKFKEVKRENGQLYLIELEHSSGVKQYIEETDSDGNIESEATDIEDTPNLPKWKLGSW